MSKAKIVEHLGRGQYRVKLLIDVEAIKERIKVLDDQITQSTALINGKLKEDIASAKSALNAIDVTQNDSDTQQKLADAHHQLDKANQDLAREKADRESKITELGKLKAVDEETIKDLWCADYNLDLEKDLTVGVIDLYQLRDTTTSNRQIIVPGYIDSKPECAYNPIRDGRLTPAFTLTPNSWWYAMMTCAGLERFNPRYRKGEITFIYNLTGSELEAEINKATVQVNASKDEVKRLDDLIHEKNANMNDLTDALETLQTELQELQDSHAEPELITAKQQQINDKQIEITDLENETNSLKYDLQLAQEQLDADQSHLNALNAGHNLCNVTVDSNYTQLRPSEMHTLSNKELYLRNVPARYLSCDELAFKVGDRVVLEYPLKNIHTRLMAIYYAKLTDLTRVKAERQSKIDAKQAEIDAKQAEIEALQTKADELTAVIKTENDENGITDLQAQIDALEDDITALNQDINTYQDDKDSAQSDVNNLSKQITDKQAQLISLQQQLDDLITSGANQSDIDAKQAEITNCLSDIASLQNDLQQATQALSEADVNLNNSLAAKKAKMQEKNDTLNIITPLLNVNTLSKQELKFTLEDIVFKNNELRGLEDDRLVLDISIAGIDAQVLNLQQLEAQETARSDKLKIFADTRPKEITIVGFESNPRPCGVHLTIMKPMINKPPLPNDTTGKYANQQNPPYQKNDNRWIFSTPEKKLKVKGFYAGGGAERTPYLYDFWKSTAENTGIYNIAHSEGGSWRGFLGEKEVAVSWSYYDPANYTQNDSAVNDYAFLALNNCYKEYTVYIAGAFGNLPRFCPESDNKAVPVSGMCLFDNSLAKQEKQKRLADLANELEQTQDDFQRSQIQIQIDDLKADIAAINAQKTKYKLAVFYRTPFKKDAKPHLLTFEIAKTNDQLEFTESSRLEININSNAWNILSIQETLLTRVDGQYLRDATGFTNDGKHLCVFSIKPARTTPPQGTYYPFEAMNNYVEMLRFSDDYATYTTTVVYNELDYKQNGSLLAEPYFGVIADDDRFCAYRRSQYFEDFGSSARWYEKIDIIEIPLEGFWRIKRENIGGYVEKITEITTYTKIFYRTMLFMSAKHDIYQFYDIDNLNIARYCVTIIKDQTSNKPMSFYEFPNFTMANAIANFKHTYRWMAVPYTDKLLILGTFDAYSPANTLLIDLETYKVTELDTAIDAETHENQPTIISPIGLMHFVF